MDPLAWLSPSPRDRTQTKLANWSAGRTNVRVGGAIHDTLAWARPTSQTERVGSGAHMSRRRLRGASAIRVDRWMAALGLPTVRSGPAGAAIDHKPNYGSSYGCVSFGESIHLITT